MAKAMGLHEESLQLLKEQEPMLHYKAVDHHGFLRLPPTLTIKVNFVLNPPILILLPT
jgi:hypothetical protein